MTSRTDGLLAKIYSEGYCCLNGYLRLCKARGETASGMAENIGISPHTLWYHQRKLTQGKLTCHKTPDCLDTVIVQIQAEKIPPKQDSD